MIGMTVCRAKLHFPNSLACLLPLSDESFFYSSQLFRFSCVHLEQLLGRMRSLDAQDLVQKKQIQVHMTISQSVPNGVNLTAWLFLFPFWWQRKWSCQTYVQPVKKKSMFNLRRNCGLVVTFCHVHEWLGRTLKEVWIELVTERNDPKLPS